MKDCVIETLTIEGNNEDSKVSGFLTILNHLNPKLSSSTSELDFTWKICYGLTTLKTVIKKKKASTKLKMTKSILFEINEILQKQNYLSVDLKVIC